MTRSISCWSDGCSRLKAQVLNERRIFSALESFFSTRFRSLNWSPELDSGLSLHGEAFSQLTTNACVSCFCLNDSVAELPAIDAIPLDMTSFTPALTIDSVSYTHLTLPTIY